MGEEVTDFRWAVEERDTGSPCASGHAPDQEGAMREVTSYAMQYAQDHPVRWWVKKGRKLLVQGSMAGATVGAVSRGKVPG